jgi:hypothetical protein
MRAAVSEGITAENLTPERVPRSQVLSLHARAAQAQPLSGLSKDLPSASIVSSSLFEAVANRQRIDALLFWYVFRQALLLETLGIGLESSFESQIEVCFQCQF